MMGKVSRFRFSLRLGRVDNVSRMLGFPVVNLVDFIVTLDRQVDAFLDQLLHYDKENVHENCLKAIRPYLADPDFDPDFIRAKVSGYRLFEA